MQMKTWRRIPVALLFAILVSPTGCGDDDQTSEPDAQVQVLFEVQGISPADGVQDVGLDQIVRITFSQPIDRATVDGSAVQILAGGEPAVGRLLPDRQSIRFVPQQLLPDTEYTVRVSTEVTDASGVALGQEFLSGFVTGSVARDGSPPFDADANAPFDGQRFVNITRQVEYVLGGAEYVLDSGKNLYVIDPFDFDPRSAPPTDEDLWSFASATFGVNSHRYGAVGNLDDDLEEEVVFLLVPDEGTTVLVVLDRDGAQMTLETLDATFVFGHAAFYGGMADLAVGDVDGDGLDEIVVTLLDYDTNQGQVIVLDDKLAGHERLMAMPIKGLWEAGAWTGVDFVRVAVGNVDADPSEEIVLAISPGFCRHNITLVKIDDLNQSYEEVARFETDHDPCGFYQTGLTLADLDGEAPAEIVIGNRSVGGMGGSQCMASVFLSSFQVRDATFVEFARTHPDDSIHVVGTQSSGCTQVDRPRVALHTLEVDGDVEEEILIGGLLFEYDPDSAAIIPMGFHAQLYEAGEDYVVAVDVGDVNGDDQDDVITVSKEARIRAWGLSRIHVGYDVDMQPIYQDHWRIIDERYAEGNPNQTRSVLVAANLDQDSVVVQPVFADPGNGQDRTVAHRLVSGSDQIVAVVAAPPCYDEPWQQWGDCRTGLGRAHGGEVWAGTECRVAAGVVVGLDTVLGEAIVGERVAKSFARKVLRELRAAGEVSLSRSAAENIIDVAGLGEDLVVFYNVAHHQYRYHVVAHPDPDMIGSEISANIPLAPQILAMSRDSYNLSNGDQKDIAPEVLGHVGGEPLTYPGLGSVPGILGQNASLGFTAPGVEVLEGNGASPVVLAFAGDPTEGDEISLPTESLLVLCDRGLCAGVQLDLGAPVFAAATLDATSAVLSSVGAITASHWEDHVYEYGLFAYLNSESDSESQTIRTYILVNYYVE